jgi:hypothetical protein
MACRETKCEHFDVKLVNNCTEGMCVYAKTDKVNTKAPLDNLIDGIRNETEINHPPYYNKGKIEVIDFIEDQGFNFNLGSVVKYISRAGEKNKDTYVQDLQKAVWFLNREIERVSR